MLLLIGTIVLFPFAIKAIVTASHCGLDTCGAVVLAASTTFRPILFVAILAFILSACICRARDAGLHPLVGVFPLLMLVGDQAFLQYAGADWAYSFSAGLLSINRPIYALFGVALMVLLGWPASGTLRAGSRLLDRALLIFAVLLSAAALMRANGVPLFVFTQLPRQVIMPVVLFSSYAPYAMPVFLALAGYRVWKARGVDAVASLQVPSVETPNLWQMKRAAMIAAAIALAVLSWSLLTNSEMPFPVVLIGLISFLVPAFVPTFLIYFALVATVLRFAAKRDAIAAAAIVAALIPYGFWAASLSSGLMAKAHERAAVAAIPKAELPARIDAVVIEGEAWPMINCARSRLLSGDYAVGDVLTHGQSKSPYLRFTKATANSPLNKGLAADEAPADHILIRLPRRPAFFQDRVSVDIKSPPVEIYVVDAAGPKLVAATYTADNRLPAFPPMLTTFGWYQGDNSTTSEKSCKNVGAFIQRELLDKLPPRRSGSI